MISTIQIKSWQSHLNKEILPQKFCEIPAKLLRKKSKTCLGFEVGSGALNNLSTPPQNPESAPDTKLKCLSCVLAVKEIF